jgi:hypothetical protein
LKIKVSDHIAEDIDKLTKKRILILEDGPRCRRIGQELAPLRANGHLLMGYDRKLGKTILVMNGHKKRKRRHPMYRFTMFEF